MSAKHFAAVLIVCCCAASLGAQQSPNDERGISAGKSYASGEIDTINVFNGNLNVSLPIGPAYHVGGQLDYHLSLAYGGNAWSYGSHEVDVVNNNTVTTREYDWAYPSPHSNAGPGWRLSLGGEIVLGDSGYWVWVAPDGAEHAFYETLHWTDSNEPAVHNASSVVQSVWYTRDGSYLRLIRRVTGWELDFPNGNAYDFDASGQLIQMRDAYGNTVTVETGPRTDGGAGTEWKIHDSAGRTQYVRFREGTTYNEAQYGIEASHNIVDSVTLNVYTDGSAGSGTATWQFEYNGGNSVAVQLQRRCVARMDPVLTTSIPVMMLTGLIPPASVGRYTFTYDLGDFAGTCSDIRVRSSSPTPTASGNLLTLTTPLGAKYAYAYQLYSFPAATYSYTKQPHAHVPGVATREIFDVNATPARKLSKTVYQATMFAPGATEVTRTIEHHDESRPVPVVNATKHYFSVCTQSLCGTAGEYGLPLTRRVSSGNGFLSMETLAADDAGALVVKRTSYVAYDLEGPLNTSSDLVDNLNRRVKYRRTTFENSSLWTDEAFSDFDGFGHYRTLTRTSSIAQTDNKTVFTDYNSGNGTFSMNSAGIYTGGYTRKSWSDRWLLGTFASQRVTNAAGTYSQTETCFDSTGLVLGRRVYAALSSTTRSNTDLVTAFAHDSNGNLTAEKYAGGDVPLVGTHHPAPVDSRCGENLTDAAYEIDHRYTSGMRIESRYAGQSFHNLDQDVDLASGLLKAGRSGATVGLNGVSNDDGLTTTFTYDPLGRLVRTAPAASQSGPVTTYTYTSAPPSVDVVIRNSASQMLAHSTTYFDVLGRTLRTTSDVPGGGTTTVETGYDMLGRPTMVSESEPTPTHFSIFSYDGLGRLIQATRPDGTSSTAAYPDVTTVKRIVGIQLTAGAAPASVVTEETYDGEGKLRSVKEPSGHVTSYDYDVAGRLKSVCAPAATCDQHRIFTYDNRGYLLSEQHPEKGAAGNGVASYTYDALGHVLRHVGGSALGAHDLAYQYDSAGRLTAIVESRLTSGEHRNLKLFTYGSNNVTGTDYRNGRITRAVRYNWFDSLGYVDVVSEDYTYGAIGGGTSERLTFDQVCTITTGVTCNAYNASAVRAHEFSQTFQTDELGQETSIGYPRCTSGCGSTAIAARTVTNTFSRGLLTGVSGQGVASSLSYNVNGFLTNVGFGATGKSETIEQDPTGMARPYRLQTTANDPQACVKPTFSVQPASRSTIASLSVTLTALAVGDSSGSAVSYAWYSGTTGTVGSVLATTASIVVNPSSTTSYWVRATNDCGSVDSATAVVTICDLPAITTQPAATTTTRGVSKRLQVSASGSGLRYQWYSVSGATATLIPAATAYFIDAAPDVTTTYRVKVSNDCGSVVSDDVVLTIYAPPSAPVSIGVVWNGTAAQISWAPSTVPAGVLRYEIDRYPDHPAPAWPNGTGTLFSDGTITTGNAYAYRVRVVDVNGVASPWSETDFALMFTFTDATLVSQATPIRAVHVEQLRAGIDALRQLAGLTKLWNGAASVAGSSAKLQDVVNMRNALNEARTMLGGPALLFQRPTLTTQSVIQANDIQELRDGLR